MVPLTQDNASHPLSPQARRILALLLVALAAVCGLSIGALSARDRHLTRGIASGLPEPITQGGARLGVNVQLEQYGDELPSILRDIRSTGIDYVKQSFNYSESFDWAAADRIVAAAAHEGVHLVPLLDGDPATNFSPPDDVTAFAAWAGEFARRYGDELTHYIIWDEPNLASHWGGGPANPAAYAALLSASADAIRGVDPDAVIVAAPLAPTTETGPQNLSEPLFLHGLYEAGAAGAFDVVAAKPYGFDNGPEDRRVAVEHLNFSRPILLRELMMEQGDGDKAIWAGNWGWNSLPADWTGEPSIWGQSSEAQQAEHTVNALERARREWPWMGVLFLENWEPDAPADDPRWGFSIAGRETAAAISSYLRAQPPDVAMPGFRLASDSDLSQQFEGAWEFSPEFGADIGQSGDRVRFSFWGTDVGIRVRRADFRARLYATVDGQPANALPRDENGAALVLTSPDPAEDFIAMEWLARDLSPGPHVLELTAERGWDQWALNGFSAGYHPLGASQDWLLPALGLLGLLFLGGAVLAARGAEWGAAGRAVTKAYARLSERSQLLLTGFVAALVGVTGWLSWGPDALGIYRRLGDAGQLAATAAAATVFYVTPSFILFTLALGILFFLLVLRPAWGLALVALTIPFYVPPLPKPILGYHFSPVEVFTWVAAAALATRALLDMGLAVREKPLRLPRPRPVLADAAVLAFVLVATVSLFFTERQSVAISEWRVVIVEPVLFYLLLRVARLSHRERWIILDAYVLSGLIIAFYGLWQYATGQNLITAEGGLMRLRSIYGSPNNVALYLDRLLPLLVAMALLGHRQLHTLRKTAYAVAIIPIGLALLLTFSKGALFLGVPASLLVVFWVWQRRAGRRTWPWLIAAGLAGLVALVLAGQIPALAARLDLFGATGFFRVHLWRAAVNMFLEHPWLGVGLDNFLYAYRGRYILDAAWQEPNLNHPHNILLDFATRLGLLGLIVGSWMIWEAGAALVRSIRHVDGEWLPVAAGFAGSLAAILAHGLVDHSFFLVDLAYVFFLLMATGLWLAGQSPGREDVSLSESVLPGS